MTRVRSLLLLAAAACLAAPAAAETPQRVTEDDIRAEELSRTARWTGTMRARLTYPQTASFGIGAIRSKLPASWECVATCPYQGWIVQVEPGVHGIQAAAGYGTLLGEQRHRRRFLADAWLGWAVKGVVLRTWDGASLGPDERNWAGAEFAFTVTRVNFSLGTLRRLGGEGDREWILTGGIGWGF
jgi:hypothetical protein